MVGVLSPLDRKVLRDLRRMWAQVLAIALVIACGAATLILAIGSYRSLDETRRAYYDRHRFGHVFAGATRAPLSLEDAVVAIPGVAATELRIAKPVLLDIAGMGEPAAAIAISVPEGRDITVNRLYLRSGRLPAAERPDEVAVNAPFAAAHGFAAGSSFAAIINGRKRTLTIVGTVLSPEYVYALGPGSLVPDDRRFGILYMNEDSLAGAFDLDGAFNSVSLHLLRGAQERAVMDRLDALLEPYGGTGAYGRRDQMSHAFLDGELTQLQAMARVIPPVFLFVSAFLINMILSRLIALEREQIGLLKAIGYGDAAVALHYAKLILAITALGLVIGFAAGTWLGNGLTRLFAEFYHFPFLIFRHGIDVYAIAGGVSIAAALAGGLRAIGAAVALKPAVAMRPPAPTRYRRLLLERLGLLKAFSRLTVMALRHLIRWPVRTALTSLGTALAVALLVTALFTFDSVDFMIETIFFRTDRQDATLTFADDTAPDVVQAIAGLPGTLRVEPYRQEPVILRNGHYERRLSIIGKPPDADLSRVLDLDLDPVVLPERGLAVSERVADLLHLRRGQTVEVEVLEGHRRRTDARVAAIIQSYLGLMVYMRLDALDRLAGEGPRVSGAHIAADPAYLDALYRRVKETPAIASISLQDAAHRKLRETVERNVMIMTTLYVTLAVIVAFGVVYNSARIQLSERARELASLRVLGFTRGEVFRVLFIELAVIVLVAQPLGWLFGAGFAWLVTRGFQSDQFRIPLVLEADTGATASLIVLGSALLSALIVRRRVNRLDLIEVLKTRE